ncbi:MAG: hypothetical protein U5L04_01020 [Trueperaceae bacterium]|nr:hypothetical protein [Trueperaceae bacterium]
MNDEERIALILKQADIVENGQSVEDNRIELKRQVEDDHHKAARQIGGLLNASRGEYVLWIIGLDEKRGVLGAEQTEMSNWWPKVKRRFEGTPPKLYIISAAHEKGNLVGLFFETKEIPCIIKNKDESRSELEVPWRDANGTRSAEQSDLRLLLLDIPETPEVEISGGHITFHTYDHDHTGKPYMLNTPIFYFQLELFFKKKKAGTITIPVHRCEVSLMFNDGELINKGSIFQVDSLSPDTVKATPYEVSISGPGTLQLSARVCEPDFNVIARSFQASVGLEFVETGDSVAPSARFMPKEGESGSPFTYILDKRHPE